MNKKKPIQTNQIKIKIEINRRKVHAKLGYYWQQVQFDNKLLSIQTTRLIVFTPRKCEVGEVPWLLSDAKYFIISHTQFMHTITCMNIWKFAKKLLPINRMRLFWGNGFRWKWKLMQHFVVVAFTVPQSTSWKFEQVVLKKYHNCNILHTLDACIRAYRVCYTWNLYGNIWEK